jgi:hypothetical protein
MPERSPWWEFEQFVREILRRTPGVEVIDEPGAFPSTGFRKDAGFDIEALRYGRPLLVEIKTQTPQTSARLNDLTSQLWAAVGRYRHRVGRGVRPELLFVFPGVISRSKRSSTEQGAVQIEIWDGRDLRRRARESSVPVPDFVATLEGEEDADVRRPAEELSNRLKMINPGLGDAPVYEKWCEDMLSFLFCPPLNLPIVQHRNESGANRRDLIMPNYATRGFWHFMRSHYRADYVVAEAKNTSRAIDKQPVLQLANYLSRHGTGLFGMLLTRRGMNTSARWTRREHWVLHDKMIIALDDEDMLQMLETKLARNEPTDLIKQRIEDFRLRI